MILSIKRSYALVFLVAFCACSKFNKLDGNYYSAQQDCFVIEDKTGAIENKRNYVKDELHLKQTDNKLKFRDITYSPGRFLFKKNVYKYYFKILNKTEDSFMVSPISKRAKEYYDHRDSIVFKTMFRFADQTNIFTKIIYHSSRCFGYCNDLHLELDYSGNLKVTNNGNGRTGSTDSARNDNYAGKVSYDDLERLRRILTFSQLKSLEWPAARNCFDAPTLTLILYQNEKRYYFKINAICLPIISRQLTGFLNGLFRYESLKKVDTTFTYER